MYLYWIILHNKNKKVVDMIHKIIFWIMVILTVFWIYEFIMNIVFWIGEEEDRIFPWKGISIIIFHMLITIFLYLHIK